ncbi:MAG: 4-hydroxy-tetrahydrodipicolinate synthase [Verrucomicrobiales bacterium]|nr:4-hydroxy-tetrahydrodipicolinate synthase [Verrucomicrobiales bacterium]
MFAGAHTALATPFLDDGTIDAEKFRKLIDASLENGISGVVPTGTTGESPTLSHEEHNLVIELAVKHTKKRGLVIAGTGSNSTREAITMTQHAEQIGADAALLVAPYYNKPSQEGLFQHYRAIANATELPLMLYSIPGRCVVEIAVDTVVRLAEACPNIRAIKEAGGVTQRVVDLRAALPDDFEILSGDDALTVDFMKVGGCGIVSVASNLIPKVMADIAAAMLDGKIAEAEALNEKYTPLFESLLKLDTNPVPIKAALSLAGICSDRVRLPMVRMAEDKKAELLTVLQNLNLA